MKKLLYKTAITVIAAALFSCNDWLDVAPRQQVEASVLFQQEKGFKTALTAAYVNMVSADMYGTEMTYGLVDALGGVYPQLAIYHTYNHAKIGEYDYPAIETKIKKIWNTSYETIAFLNNLIEHLREADLEMFARDNYNVILGEALGLRAFIHFDLLRLFTPSYLADRTAQAIPYVTQSAFTITPLSTVTEVLNYIMRDANEALELLKASDPIYTGCTITLADDDGYLLNRQFNMNYYAVLGFMARVHLYRGELSDAARYAEEVKTEMTTKGLVRWTTFSEVSNAEPASRNRALTPEHIFALECRKLDTYASDLFFYDSRLRNFHFSPAQLTSLYPDASDRRRYLFRPSPYAGAGTNQECIKYGTIGGVTQNRLPMIRLPEMYLILAEALLQTNPVRSAELLNEMALNRGIPDVVDISDPPETIGEAIFMEYRREFIGEGQMFYYHKRLDLPSIEGAPEIDQSKYVLPMPPEEKEFGKR